MLLIVLGITGAVVLMLCMFSSELSQEEERRMNDEKTVGP